MPSLFSFHGFCCSNLSSSLASTLLGCSWFSSLMQDEYTWRQHNTVPWCCFSWQKPQAEEGEDWAFFCPEIINLLSYGFNLSIVLFVLHLLASFRESVKRQMLKAGERCLTQWAANAGPLWVRHVCGCCVVLKWLCEAMTFSSGQAPA